MQVQRHPGIVVDLLPQRGGFDILGQRHARYRLRGRVHERGRTVDYEQRDRPDDVQQHSKRDVAAFLFAFPRVPGIEIQVQDDRLRDEQQWIDECEDQEEVVDQPGRELGVGAQQYEDEQAAGQRGHAVENHGDFGDFPGEPVIARVLLAVPQPLRNDHEDRSPENKRGKEDVQLRDNPDGRPVANVRKLSGGYARDLRIGHRTGQADQAQCHEGNALPTLHGLRPHVRPA